MWEGSSSVCILMSCPRLQKTSVRLLQCCVSDKYATIWDPGALCTGEKGIGNSGKPLHFEGSGFHRVIKGLTLALFGSSRSRLTSFQQFHDTRGGFHHGKRLVNQFCNSHHEC